MSVWQPWSVADVSAYTKLTAILFPAPKFTERNQWKAVTADIPQYNNVEHIIMLSLQHFKQTKNQTFVVVIIKNIQESL